jgi:hypothetical protein
MCVNGVVDVDVGMSELTVWSDYHTSPGARMNLISISASLHHLALIRVITSFHGPKFAVRAVHGSFISTIITTVNKQSLKESGASFMEHFK